MHLCCYVHVLIRPPPHTLHITHTSPSHTSGHICAAAACVSRTKQTCPTTNGRSDGICDGKGVCGVVRSTESDACVCDEGFTGVNCKTTVGCSISGSCAAANRFSCHLTGEGEDDSIQCVCSVCIRCVYTRCMYDLCHVYRILHKNVLVLIVSSSFFLVFPPFFQRRVGNAARATGWTLTVTHPQ